MVIISSCLQKKLTIMNALEFYLIMKQIRENQKKDLDKPKTEVESSHEPTSQDRTEIEIA